MSSGRIHGSEVSGHEAVYLLHVKQRYLGDLARRTQQACGDEAPVHRGCTLLVAFLQRTHDDHGELNVVLARSPEEARRRLILLRQVSDALRLVNAAVVHPRAADGESEGTPGSIEPSTEGLGALLSSLKELLDDHHWLVARHLPR